MSANRDEIRDHLTAVIEAARELPKEDRTYLADTFLDDLEQHYQLVPRGSGGQRSAAQPGRSWRGGFPVAWSPVPIALVILAAAVFLPVLLFTLGVFLHPPFILLAVLLFFIFRSRSRRGGRHHGPRGRNMIV